MIMHLHHPFTKYICYYYILLQCITIPTSLAYKRVNFHKSVMSTGETIAYIKSFMEKSSTLDIKNEKRFTTEEHAEELHSKIESLMFPENFIKWLMKTRYITDKVDEKKSSLLAQYGSSPNDPCNPIFIFYPTLGKVMQKWEENHTDLMAELEEWQNNNENTAPFELCNRFRGLTCQKEVPSGNSSCQCEGDSMNVGFFNQDTSQLKPTYPDGCYIKPWRPCQHLSVSDSFYDEWHSSMENERKLLAQIIFPVARTHRCKKGTYCLDLIPGMNQPICWCSGNSDDKECLHTKNENDTKTYVPPLSLELFGTRRNFAKLIIPATDKRTACNPEYNDQVLKLTKEAEMDPSVSRGVDIMKNLSHISHTVKKIRLCDFRKGLICGTKLKTCKEMDCLPGRVRVGKGGCLVDNGAPCLSTDECVSDALCEKFPGRSDSICVCETGYGPKCHLKHKPPFFGKKFLRPMESGIEGKDFSKLQGDMFRVLLAWEKSMTRKVGESCNPSLDRDAMEVVNYFGSLHKYDKKKGSGLLEKANKVVKASSRQLCQYNKFQRCDAEQSKCVPMQGARIASESENPLKIKVEADSDMECTLLAVPKIFEDAVSLACAEGYTCEVCEPPECTNATTPIKKCLASQERKGRNLGQLHSTGKDRYLPRTPLKDDNTIESFPPIVKSLAMAMPNETKQDTNNPNLARAGMEGQNQGENSAGQGENTSANGENPPKNGENSPEQGENPRGQGENPDGAGNGVNPTKLDTSPPVIIKKGFGEPCNKSDDCQKFLYCNKERKQCMCVLIKNWEWWLIGKPGQPCELQIDGGCDDTFIRTAKEMATPVEVSESPKCRDEGVCLAIHKGNYCRPKDENGAMFISEKKLKELSAKQECKLCNTAPISKSSSFAVFTFAVVQFWVVAVGRMQ